MLADSLSDIDSLVETEVLIDSEALVLADSLSDIDSLSETEVLADSETLNEPETD